MEKARADQPARESGFAKASGDWLRLIENPKIDVVSITSPNQFHAEMAIAALEAGKTVWCERPMAPKLRDAEAMLAAARKSGRVAASGDNYIQTPMIRQIGQIIKDGTIGDVSHVRIEMDEDFMADPEKLSYWKSQSSSGYGVLDDFGVHPRSLLHILFGDVREVMCDMAKPYGDRPLPDGSRREVETHDVASVLIRMDGGISGSILLSRSAWGRKGRIALQIFGSKGSILLDQERMNAFQLYPASEKPSEQGYRTIMVAPVHAPFGKFIPAPGHGPGFNGLKTIECRELIHALHGDSAQSITFEEGIRIEKTVHAMAQSFDEGRWVKV
jgi:predicted dehydrogenase